MGGKSYSKITYLDVVQRHGLLDHFIIIRIGASRGQLLEKLADDPATI